MNKLEEKKRKRVVQASAGGFQPRPRVMQPPRFGPSPSERILMSPREGGVNRRSENFVSK